MPRARKTLLNMLLGFYNPRIPIRQPQFIRRPVYIQPKPQPKPEPKLPIQCDVIQPLNELKAVFLLELSSGTHVSTDVNIKKTLEYYWDNHPNEFSRCPIEDTKGDINVLLSLLDKYYAKGYRNFSGFTSSNVVKNVIPWFNEHPCARGITSLGSLTALEKIPKNIFRLTPNILSRIETIFPNITSKKIYFIYTKGFLVNDEITNELQEFKKQGIINDIIVYEEDEITLSGVTNFFKNSTENDVLITNLTNNLEDFLDIISTASVSIGSIYEIGAIRTPVIKPQNSSFLENKYYFLELVGVCTSILLRNAKKSLGNDFKNTVINQLNMLNEFKKSDSFENCNSHVGITDFDSASKYLLYSNILINKLSSENKFISEKMYINDPYVGKYFANFISEQTVLQSNILMNPRNISGKVIALLEINNPNLNFDTILNYGILYYWNYDKTLPRFPIINIYTNGVNDNELINNTIVLLDKYYRDGYRIFFGFSRSTILKGVNDWFAKHSDAVALSCFSTSIDRELIDRTNTNVYRLEYSDDYIVDSILPLINTNEKIFYLYSGNENAAINIKDYITKNITSELLFYNIDIPGNYTEYVITEKNLQNKRLPTFVKVDENIKYSWLDFESSYICDRYYIFNHLKNINMKTVPHDKIKIESDVVLICKFDNTNKLFVEFLSNNNHFITVHVNDITQPNNHHNRHVSTLNSNNWWAMDFDDNLYEIRIFHQGILLYSTILVKVFENISKFRLYTYVFK